MKKQWIDISIPLQNNIAVWPGDTPFQYEVQYTKEQTGSVNIGKLTMSCHTGTHIDAPFHFDTEGKKVLDLDINTYIGEAVVIDVSLYKEINATLLDTFDFYNCSRVLLKTNYHSDIFTFPTRIPALSDDVGPALRKRNVTLLGIDLPSVDAIDSKSLVTHHSLYHNGVHILENIVLTDVSAGKYELIALPLPLCDGDGSPVRAVLREIEKGE